MCQGWRAYIYNRFIHTRLLQCICDKAKNDNEKLGAYMGSLKITKTITGQFYTSVFNYKTQPALVRKESGEWVATTYGDLAKKASSFSKFLYANGIRPGDRVALMLENSPEWAIADLGTLSIGAADVPLYATVSDEQAKYILDNSGAKVVVVNGEAQLIKLKNVVEDLKKLELVVTVKENTGPIGDKKVVTLSSALESGSNVNEDIVRKVKEAEDCVEENLLASIIYTSGTTGMPKGVMITHGNFMHNVEATLNEVHIDSSDRHLSFLPLSHVFERMAGHISMLSVGATIYYAESVEKIPDNIKEIKPTVVISVPRLFEKMVGKIKDKVANAPKARQKLFNWAIDVGTRYTDRTNLDKNSLWLGIQHKIANKLVFSKLAAAFGGNIRYFVSGGAPLNIDLAIFFRAVGIKVLEGYGLTETSPVIAMNPPNDIRAGTVGKKLSNLELKFLSDGELLVRGPSISKGYFDNQKATKDAIDSNGWFHTGDIAEMDDDGYIRITDRKKDLIVMSNGQNVPPQSLESSLVGDEFIVQAVAIGNNRNFMTALIVPNFVRLERELERIGISNTIDKDALVENEKVVELYAHRLEKLMVSFANYERIKKFKLLTDEFSEAGGELTPTLKVKRKIVLEKYSNIIDEMYSS